MMTTMPPKTMIPEDNNQPQKPPVVDDSRRQGMWSTFKSELAGPYFPQTTSASSAAHQEHNDLEKQQQHEETSHEEQVVMNDEMIQRAYFPAGLKVMLAKLVLRGWALAAFVMQFTESNHPHFTMAFLTNWSLLATCIYMIISFVASLISTYYSWSSTSSSTSSSLVVASLSSEIATATTTTATTPSDSSSTTTSSNSLLLPPKLHNFFFKAIAIMFPIVAVQELLVIFFWIDPMVPAGEPVPLSSILAHGPLWPLILVDGLLLNAIQVRPRQIVFVWVFQCAFLLWTVLYSVADIMNPHAMNMNMDEAIYEGYLNWKLYPGKTLVGAVTIVMLVTPIYFALIWMLSFWTQKYYWKNKNTSRNNSNSSWDSEDGATTTKKQSSAKSLVSTIDGTALEEEQIEKDLEAEASSTHRRGSVRARRRSTKAKITLEDGEEIITEITV